MRGLERKIASVCRKAAKAVAQADEGTKTKLRISDRNIKEYLGKPVYKPNAANEKPEVGIVRGLALNQCWRRDAGDRGRCIKRHRQAGAYRKAWRCDEGISQDRTDLCPFSGTG